jgi:MFS transporter, DHA1 family, multidrug resistance protein
MNSFRIKSPGLSANQFYSMLPIYLIVFFSFFDTHAQMPILAPFAVSLGATPFLIGLVVGTYSLFNITGNFTSGAWIDKTSWKMPLFIGLAGVSLILALYPQAVNPAGLIAIRAAHGYMGGILVPAALACLTKGQDSANHGNSLALFGASIGLAAVTGPMFAGITANSYGFSAVYYSLAAMMATATALSLIPLLRSKLPLCPYERPLLSFRQIAGLPPLKSAFCFALGTMGSTGALASFLPTRAALLGLNPAQTGMLFATFALTAILVQATWPKFFKPLFRKNLRGGAAGLALISLALIIAASAVSSLGLYLALALFGVGFGFSFQSMLGLVVAGSELQWRGRAIGLFFAVYSLGVALMPPFSGLVWQLAPAIFPFYTAAAGALVWMVIGYRVSAVR